MVLQCGIGRMCMGCLLVGLAPFCAFDDMLPGLEGIFVRAEFV